MPHPHRDGIDNSQSPTFGSNFSAILNAVDHVFSSQRYPATVELYRQGDAANDVYLLESGLVKLVRVEPDGQELIVALRFPGSLIGNFSVIMNNPYPLTAITLIDSHVRRIPAEQFRQLVQTNLEFSWHVHQMHCRTAFDHVLRVVGLTFTTARQRLEQLLWQLALVQTQEPEVKDLWLTIPLRYWELAALIAVSPGYLSRLFGQLEKDGVLLRIKGRLIVPDPEKLWHQAEA